TISVRRPSHAVGSAIHSISAHARAGKTGTASRSVNYGGSQIEWSREETGNRRRVGSATRKAAGYRGCSRPVRRERATTVAVHKGSMKKRDGQINGIQRAFVRQSLRRFTPLALGRRPERHAYRLIRLLTYRIRRTAWCTPGAPG